MGHDDLFHDAINLFYEAAVDASLWPAAVARLADATGIAQIGLGTFDHRNRTFVGLAPRICPQMLADYQDYWSSRDPIWPKIAAQAAGKLFSSDDLIPREEYAATDVYNQWFRPAKIGLSVLGANLRAGNEFSVTIFAANAPGSDQISREQAHALQAALPHVSRAIKMHRQLRVQDLDRDIAPEMLEHAGIGVLLVDRAAKVLFANAWARALLVPGCGLTLQGGYLFSTDRAASLHRLIAACHACRNWAPAGSGGEIRLRRTKRRPLNLTVTPLRARGRVAELPWLGLQMPAAMVTIHNPAKEKWCH
ncbi:MAG: hypothetical protein J2P49_10640 [Methylocapsa sp.]|nr:hypothetical protein [Methylocapsa sp.]